MVTPDPQRSIDAVHTQPGSHPPPGPDAHDGSSDEGTFQASTRSGDAPGAVAALLNAGTVRNWSRTIRLVCRRGYLDDARLLLDAGVLDLAPRRGLPPLVSAAAAGQLPMVQLLLSAGADPAWSDPHDGWTALTFADAGEHPSVVEALVTAGADPRSRLRHGMTPMMRAVRAEPADPDRLRDALSRWPELLEARDDGGSTPLYAAAYRADETPDRAAVLQQLLASGADPNARCGSTRDLPAFETLRQTAVSPIAMRRLLDAGTDVHATDSTGQSLMHQAALWGDAAVIELLAARGVPVDSRDDDGVTPLLRSLEFLGAENAMALLALGADATAVDHAGAGAFHWVARHVDPQLRPLTPALAAALLDAGANPGPHLAAGGSPEADYEHPSSVTCTTTAEPL